MLKPMLMVFVVYAMIGLALQTYGYFTPWGRNLISNLLRITRGHLMERAKLVALMAFGTIVWPIGLMRGLVAKQRDEVLQAAMDLEREPDGDAKLNVAIGPNGELSHDFHVDLKMTCIKCKTSRILPPYRTTKLDGWMLNGDGVYCPECAPETVIDIIPVGVRCIGCNETVIFDPIPETAAEGRTKILEAGFVIQDGHYKCGSCAKPDGVKPCPWCGVDVRIYDQPDEGAAILHKQPHCDGWKGLHTAADRGAYLREAAARGEIRFQS